MPLYMVDAQTDALYTRDVLTGAATLVGDAVDFEIGEGFPSSLAWHGNQLFMAGAHVQALMVLDRDTGIALRVGTAVQFGVGEDHPAGMTSDGTSLFMVGEDNQALYTVDPDTGIATQVGTAVSFGTTFPAEETTPRSLVSINGTLYMGGRLGFYRLDKTTGEATRLFDVDDDLSWVNISGLAYENGTLYGVERSGDRLLSLNRNNGDIEIIGRHDIAEAEQASGLAWIPAIITPPVVTPGALLDDTFYVLAYYPDTEVPVATWALHSMDKATGALTRAGGAVHFGVNTQQKPLGLAWDGTNLYMTIGTVSGHSSAQLYTLDQTTGVATLVGVIDYPSQLATTRNASGLDWNGTHLVSRYFDDIDGTLDAETWLGITIDRTTAVATLFPEADIPSTDSDYEGIAWDGEKYWDILGDRLRGRSVSLSLSERIDAPAGFHFGTRLAWDGAYFYMSGLLTGVGARVLRVSTFGEVVVVGVALTEDFAGITWVGDIEEPVAGSYLGNSFYTYGYYGNTVYKMDVETNIASAIHEYGQVSRQGVQFGRPAPFPFDYDDTNLYSYFNVHTRDFSLVFPIDTVTWLHLDGVETTLGGKPIAINSLVWDGTTMWCLHRDNISSPSILSLLTIDPATGITNFKTTIRAVELTKTSACIRYSQMALIFSCMVGIC